MWTESKALPADEKFDASLIDDPFLKDVYDKWWVGDHNAYVADLMPTLFWTDAMFVELAEDPGRRDDRRAGRAERAGRQREVGQAESRHGRELQDLGQGSGGWAVGERREGSRPRARHAEDPPLGAVPVRAPGVLSDRVHLRVPGRAGRELLVPPHPREQRALGRLPELRADLRRSDLPSRGQALRASPARGPDPARDLGRRSPCFCTSERAAGRSTGASSSSRSSWRCRSSGSSPATCSR